MRAKIVLFSCLFFFNFNSSGGWALEHIVKEGENFSSILAQYAPDTKAAIRANNLSPQDLTSLPVGRHLIIPHPLDETITGLRRLADDARLQIAEREAELKKKARELEGLLVSSEKAQGKIERLKGREETFLLFQWLTLSFGAGALSFLVMLGGAYMKIRALRSERDLSRKHEGEALAAQERLREKYNRRFTDLHVLAKASSGDIKAADELLEKSVEKTGSSFRALQLVKGLKEGRKPSS